MTQFLIALLLCWQTLCFAQNDDEIIVRLGTENQLLPLYLSHIIDEDSGLSTSYLKQLEEVMRFDFNHNGMTTTLTNTPERDQAAAKLSITKSLADAYYIIQMRITNQKKPSIMLYAANGDNPKAVEGKALTGDLTQDRRLLHLLSDTIYKTLFGANGIASTHILYSVKKKSGNKWSAEIWEADYDGFNARPIIQDGSYSITPVYIPPKEGLISGAFLYVSYKTSLPKIYIASLKEGVGRRLNTLRGNQLMPAISKQRDQIAFICDVTGNPDLFVQPFSVENGVTDKPRQIFASRKATQGTPTFSPDGHRIAFVSNKDGSPKVYAMDIPSEGTPLKDLKPQLISRHSKESSAPTWSPDGTKVAYCAMANGIRQIWVYDFSTKEERQLTQGPGNKENPTWAPNSLCLMYNTSGSENNELYLTSLNQSQSTKISSGSGEKRFPNWEPR